MRRREFIRFLGGAAAFAPLAARAQQVIKRPLVAWLGGGSRQVATRNLNAFLEGLREHGHEDGKNIDIVYRWADGDMSRFPTLAKELVALNPAVVVSAANAGAVVLKQTTSAIQIVGALLVDPVRLGLAESHDRPGSNVTGILYTIDSLPGKQVELLLQLIPQATTIGVLMNPVNPAHPIVLRDAAAAVRGTSIKFIPVEVRTPADFEGAFEILKRNRADGLMILVDGLFFTNMKRIITLTEAARLPSIDNLRQHVEQGGLMSYGVNITENFRRAAYFVDRILKGTRAGDLPIELPTKLELVINLKTAKTLGLEVPSKLIFTADDVIE